MPRKAISEAATEVRDAIAIGRKDSELARVLQMGGQVLFVQRIAAGRGPLPAREHVLLGVYDYDRDRSLIAVIDPAREAVEGVHESRARFQLSNEERRAAEELAAADPRVKSFLGERAMNPLTRLYFPHGARADATHRHAIVFLRPTRHERHYAVVDLTTREVVDVLTRSALTGE